MAAAELPTPPDVLVVWFWILLIDALRYLVPASAAFAVLWVWGRERFRGAPCL